MTNARRWSSALAAIVLAAACSSGSKNTRSQTTPTTTGKSPFRLTSTAFANGAAIPRQYTCAGAGTIPPLSWSGTPSGTARLMLRVHDPDAPVPGGFTHWVVLLPPRDATVPPLPADASEDTKWTPPCPPPGKVHHYDFSLLALPAGDRGAAAALATASLVGTYSR